MLDLRRGLVRVVATVIGAATFVLLLYLNYNGLICFLMGFEMAGCMWSWGCLQLGAEGIWNKTPLSPAYHPVPHLFVFLIGLQGGYPVGFTAVSISITMSLLTYFVMKNEKRQWNWSRLGQAQEMAKG